MIKLVENSWITAPVGAIVYLACTVLFWETPKLPAKPDMPVMHEAGPSWDFNNPEADQLIAELRIEKKSVETREQQLNELAARLESERAELNQVTQSVHQLQTEFDSSVLRIKDQEIANLKKLAKVYGDMSPETAATVMAEMDNEAIVKILLYLKDDQTAAVLEALAKKGQAQARRTAEISETVRLSLHNTSPTDTTK
ncbi:MAG: MotE family protein [Limisphaerales bacterium]